MHKLSAIIAGIAIRGSTSLARRKPGEPRDVSLRILFSHSIVMPQNLPILPWSEFTDWKIQPCNIRNR